MSQAVVAKQDAQVAKVDKEEEEDDDEDDDDDMLPEAQPSQRRNEVLTGMARGRQRENAVHVYGLDFLKTEHMNEIFSQLNHKYVEWINDSSANIIFPDPASAKKALDSLSFPKTGDEPWRRTPDILVSEDVPPIFLQMRYAMSTDVKPSKKSVPKAAPIQHFPPTQPQAPRRKGEFSSNRKRLYADDMSMSKEDALEVLGVTTPAPKKNTVPLTEEERLRREKRVARFGEVTKPEASSETTKPTPANSKAPVERRVHPMDKTNSAFTYEEFQQFAAEQSADAVKMWNESKRVQEPVEDTEEDRAKKQKREERFSAPAPAQAKEKGQTAEVAGTATEASGNAPIESKSTESAEVAASAEKAAEVTESTEQNEK